MKVFATASLILISALVLTCCDDEPEKTIPPDLIPDSLEVPVLTFTIPPITSSDAWVFIANLEGEVLDCKKIGADYKYRYEAPLNSEETHFSVTTVFTAYTGQFANLITFVDLPYGNYRMDNFWPYQLPNNPKPMASGEATLIVKEGSRSLTPTHLGGSAMDPHHAAKVIYWSDSVKVSLKNIQENTQLFLVDTNTRPWKFLTFSVSPGETITRTSDAFEHGVATDFTFPRNTTPGPVYVTGIKNGIQYPQIFSTLGLPDPHPSELEINIPQFPFDSYFVKMYGSEQGQSYETASYFVKEIPSTMPLLDARCISYTVTKKRNELVTTGTYDYSMTYSENYSEGYGFDKPGHSWAVFSSMNAQTYTIPLLPKELKQIYYELSEWDEIKSPVASLHEDGRFEGYENLLKPENWTNTSSFQILSKIHY